MWDNNFNNMNLCITQNNCLKTWSKEFMGDNERGSYRRAKSYNLWRVVTSSNIINTTKHWQKNSPEQINKIYYLSYCTLLFSAVAFRFSSSSQTSMFIFILDFTPSSQTLVYYQGIFKLCRWIKLQHNFGCVWFVISWDELCSPSRPVKSNSGSVYVCIVSFKFICVDILWVVLIKFLHRVKLWLKPHLCNSIGIFANLTCWFSGHLDLSYPRSPQDHLSYLKAKEQISVKDILSRRNSSEISFWHAQWDCCGWSEEYDNENQKSTQSRQSWLWQLSTIPWWSNMHIGVVKCTSSGRSNADWCGWYFETTYWRAEGVNGNKSGNIDHDKKNIRRRLEWDGQFCNHAHIANELFQCRDYRCSWKSLLLMQYLRFHFNDINSRMIPEL